MVERSIFLTDGVIIAIPPVLTSQNFSPHGRITEPLVPGNRTKWGPGKRKRFKFYPLAFAVVAKSKSSGILCA
jgi:hypothetical protein